MDYCVVMLFDFYSGSLETMTPEDRKNTSFPLLSLPPEVLTLIIGYVTNKQDRSVTIYILMMILICYKDIMDLL